MRPARQIVTRSPHRRVGIITASWIQPEPVEHESDLEKAFIELVLSCPALRGIRHQPFKIHYEVLEEPHWHVPDFLLTLARDSKVVVEIKPQRFVGKHQAKFDAVAALLKQQGVAYYVVTDAHLTRSRVRTASLWRRYARGEIDDASAAQVFGLLQVATRSWQEVVDLGVQPAIVSHLLGRRAIHCADGLDFTPDSRLLLPSKEELSDEHVCFESWFGCLPWGAQLDTETPPG